MSVVFDISASLLVHTSAAVSLLNERVWDRIELISMLKLPNVISWPE